MSFQPLELLQPHRKFLMEGPVDVFKKGEKKKDRYFVLCNDLLLVCKAAGFNKGRFLLSKRLPAGMFLVNSTPGEASTQLLLFSFLFADLLPRV